MASNIRVLLTVQGTPYKGGQVHRILKDIYAEYKNLYMPETVKKQPAWKRMVWIVENTRYPAQMELFVWREPKHANPKRSPYIRTLLQHGVKKARRRK